MTLELDHAVIEAPPQVHWLLDVAHGAALCANDEPFVDLRTPLPDAWRQVAHAFGLTQAGLAERVAQHYQMAVADISSAQFRALDLIPEKLARDRHIFPLRETDHEIVVAVADPTEIETEHLIGFVSGRRPVFEIATPDEIQEALDARYAPDRAVERLLNRVGAEMADLVRVEKDAEPETVAQREAASAPIIKLTHVILGDAVRARASDIHIEPAEDGGRVRFRVDGVLQAYARFSMPILNRVVSCIKILGKMDIADRLRPQDGRARIHIDGRTVDLRLSTVPTRESEKAVVRLLDPRNARKLEDLSLTTNELVPLRELLTRRDGIVLVTGPTGSGKTTLLYAALREMPSRELNVMTVEDPVEYELAGLTQIQVEPKRDVTFANALRSILRQDPDVIFIGEIRDAETAKIAVQASLTGHLVLASLHTNDAVGVVGRLEDLGVERGEIASTLRGATAQRLVRRVCAKCAERVNGALTEIEKRLAIRYGVEPVVRATGCAACAQTGYFGRIPLLEILVMNPDLELGIVDGAVTSQLQKDAVKGGMRPLRDAAVARVRAGETTLEEIDRELGERDREVAARAEGPQRILIVDDDAVTRSIARALLTKHGYAVVEAADGVAALDALQADRSIAMVVLDLAMPGLSGQDVLRRLRASVATSDLPVIVLTGSTDDHMEVEMMDAGANDYVRKPLDSERFLSRVNATMRRLNR